MGIDRLDDPNYPAFSIGQAAEMLGCQHAFLRSLDAAGMVVPGRSDGGHRRYSRHQLEWASRARTLLDEGFGLTAAARVLMLEDELRKAKAALTRERQVRAREQRRGQDAAG
jgi:MerR family transcriptional regulator, heat shock protein HspR